MSSIPTSMRSLRTLAREGVLALYHDYRSGAAVDFSDNGHEGSISNGVLGTYGYHSSDNSARITVPDDTSLQLTEGSIVAYSCKGFDGGNTQCSKQDAGGTNYQLSNLGSILVFFDGTHSRLCFATASTLDCIAVNFSNGEVAEGFVNGVSQGAFSGTSTVSADDADLIIYNYAAAVASVRSGDTLSALLIFNRKLTATEHARVYGELQSAEWVTRHYLSSMAKPLTTCYGCVGTWDMKLVAGKILDSSSSNAHFDTYGSFEILHHDALGNSIKFDGVSSWLKSTGFDTSLVSNYTVDMWVRADSYSGAINSNPLIHPNNTYTYPSIGIDSSKITYNRAFGSYIGASLTDNSVHHVVFTFTAGSVGNVVVRIYMDGELITTSAEVAENDLAGSGLVVGANRSSSPTAYGDAELYSLRIYDEVKSAVWVKREFNKGASAVVYATAFGAKDSGVTESSGQLSNTGWQIGSGQWKVANDYINGEVGEDLTGDGDMEDAGTSYYSADNNATLSKESGTRTAGTGAQVLRIAYNGVAYPGAFVEDSLGLLTVATVGKSYRMCGWARSDGVASPQVYLLDQTYWTGTLSTDWQYFEYVCEAKQSSTRLRCNATSVAYVEFDDVTIQECTSSVKTIECVSSGYLYIPVRGDPANVAYGSWEFWVRKSSASTLYIMIHSDDPVASAGTAYLEFAPDESIAVKVNSVGTMVTTAASYKSADTWVKMKITRSYAGVYKLYVDDTYIGSGTSNTYKTGSYIVINIDTGDKVAISDPQGNFAFKKLLGVA